MRKEGINALKEVGSVAAARVAPSKKKPDMRNSSTLTASSRDFFCICIYYIYYQKEKGKYIFEKNQPGEGVGR